MTKTLNKINLTFLGAVLIVVGTISSISAADKKMLVVGTAPAGSASFPFMVGVSAIVNKNVPNLALSPQETGGSVANIRLLDEDKIQVSGFATTIAVSAVKGEKPFTKTRKVNVLLSMYLQRYIWFAPEKTGIRSWDDVAGKKIIVGTPGGSTRVVGTLVAKVKGMDGKADLKFLRPGAMISSLRNGTADAGFGIATGSSMAPWVQEAVATMKLNIYGVDEAAIAEIIKIKPGLNRAEVPEGYLEGAGAFVTVGENLVMGAAPSLSNEDAYNIVKAVYENYDSLSKYSASAKGAERRSMVEGIPEGVPFHPGAVQFYKEVGLMK